MHSVGAQSKESFVAVVASGMDQRAVSGAERVCRRWEEERAGSGRGDRAVANSEPTKRADEVTSGSCVDDSALGDPIMDGAVAVDGVGQSGGVISGSRTRDGDDKGAERVGLSK